MGSSFHGKPSVKSPSLPKARKTGDVRSQERPLATTTMPKPITDEDLTAISASLFAGRKIGAIKRYRECAGVGLGEAKVSVEKIEADLRTAAPTKFQAPPARGCRSTAAVLIAFSLFAVWGVSKLLA